MFFSFWREVCPPNDALCEQDKIGYDSIQQLHLQIDDDNDGSLDRSESDEVSIITFTARHKKFRIDEPNLYVMPQTERVKNNTADKIIMTWHSCINPPLLPRSVPLWFLPFQSFLSVQNQVGSSNNANILWDASPPIRLR